MDIASEAPAYGALLLIHYLLPATLLATTAKRSPLRYLAIPCMLWTVSRVMQPVPSTTPTRCSMISLFGISAVQAVHLLLIEPRDDTNLSQKLCETCHAFHSRLSRAIRMLWGTRAVNTPWEYLALDIFHTLRLQQFSEQGTPQGFTELKWVVPAELWIERIISNIITWFIVSRLILDTHYRIISIVCVGLGLNPPSDWPPVFGRMADAYTLRNFWGKFWHQLLRQPFSSASSFIACDILGLPRPSFLERYTKTFLVFLLSGLLHLTIDIGQCVPIRYSGSLPYFVSFALGIMIEDGVQAVFERVDPSKVVSGTGNGSVPPLWRRTVGFIWVMVWIGVTSTWFLHPLQEAPQDHFAMIPFSVAKHIGMEAHLGIVAVSGVVLGFLLEAEV